jgi:hypothetical protein
MEGGTVTYNTQGPVVSTTTRFHPMIQDCFYYNACTFDIKEPRRWGKAYADWERERSCRILEYQWGCQDGRCSCEPVREGPQETDYFSAERTSRLLSEVLASVTKVHQIDLLPESLLYTSDALPYAGVAASQPSDGSSNSLPS